MSALELQRARPETCLSDLALERFLVGELDSSGRAATEAHLGTCLACRERRETLDAAPAQVPDMLWLRKHAPTRRSRGPLFAAAATAVAAAAALVIFARPAAIEQAPAETRLKGGGLAFEVFARRADGRVDAVFDGTPLRPGDAIRFVVSAPEAGHAAVVGLDGAGHVSIYHAPSDGAPLAVAPGKHELPGSVVLDATPGDERLVALLCPAPPARADLEAAGARALAAANGDPRRAPALDLPCRQTGLSIHKDVAP